MTGETASFLSDTLIWTGALLALVLVIRKPVARWFGPHAAYALWALPLLRLLLPPVTLPAWLAPDQPAEQAVTGYSITYSDKAMISLAEAPAAAPSIDWVMAGLAIWGIGAAIFLAVRFGFYFKMRDELTNDAVPVGEAGRVRLIETPFTNTPIAFGVIDKVVALPPGFMANFNRTERDLALEHELAHHSGHDLLINIAVQPLFALHWFNPLAWLGWRALRHDQEAACDARVIALRGEEDKAAYASVIAGFAAGPDAAHHLSLAAPMACPVIGEKSIIHRLRSLTMTDKSPRRIMAGRVLLGGALLALPLTASVSYAESLSVPNAPSAPVAASVPAAPLAPSAPGGQVPAPPAPPLPPALALQAAPEAPDAPLPPEAEEKIDVERKVFVFREGNVDEEGKHAKVKTRSHKVIIRDPDSKMTKAERKELMRELREELAEVDVEVNEAMEEYRLAMVDVRGAEDGLTKISVECKEGGGAGEVTGADGRKVVKLCTSEIMANALTGLKQARDAIASNSEMPDDLRGEVIKALDEQIRNWRSDS